MEDRHAFSEPRSAFGYDQPTWNVDVYRKGVGDPVFTLVINNETLPPRMRKKKVVWRLPDHQDLLPNFGSDEKKRLVDLFKRQKKNRRKSTKRSGCSLEQDNAELNPADDFLDDSVTRDREIWKDRQEEEHERDKEQTETKRGEMEVSSVPPTSEYHRTFLKERAKEDDRYMGTTSTVITNDGIHEITPPPPGMGMSPFVSQTIPQTVHPPGVIGNSSLPQGSQTPSTVSSRGEESPLAGSLPPPGFTMSPLNICAIGNIGADDSNNRYLNVPITSTNIPVDLAQSFMDMYYCSMTHGQQEELLLHYDHGAVKSLSLGGAHSFCKLRSEILIQLNSLQDSLWDITGVVAQDGFQNSVVLLITGSALPKTSPHPIPFCHSVTLVKNPMGYQIHNDAMSLMTPNNTGIGGSC